MDTHYYVWFTLAFRSGSKQEHPVPHKPRHRLASPSWRASSFSNTYTPEMPSGIASLKEGAKPRGNWAPGGKRELWQHEPASMDDLEIWFEKGVTDGLPVVPPTRERVERMLAGSTRGRSDLIGEVAPNYGRATTEKVVVNGPIRGRIGLNCSFGVFGPGYRANATIGRALRLVMINVGGAKPGETSMSTFGHPGRYTYCIGEHEEASPWTPYHVERGFQAGESVVTVFAGEAPHGISDHSSRTARSLAGSLGWSMCGLWN